jgi:membrane-associated protease RseP (regulator of RpoE activity)
MGQDELKQKLSETETLGADDANVARVLGGLHRAEAPKDFDFHLRARIANGAPVETARPILFPILKYAVPLCLVLLIGGFVAFSGYFTSENGASPAIAESPRTTEAVPERAVVERDTKDSNFEKTQVESANPQLPKQEEIVSDARKTSDAATNAVPPANKRSGYRTVDRGQGGRVKTINPPGINPDGTVHTSLPDTTTKTEVSTREVLKMLGVDADVMDDVWRVKAVNAGSSASRAGIQNGDIIQEINDRKVGKTIEFTGQFSGSSVTVLRGEKPLRIDLTKKQP